MSEIPGLLQSFISFESIDNQANQKKECLDWVTGAFLNDRLNDIQRGDFEGSPWLYVPGPSDGLLVFAHIDVVPGSKEMFSLKVDGDTAWGRGVSDMKGNILPFLMAFRERQPCNVGVLLTSDEEVAGNTIPHLLESNIVQCGSAFTPDSNDSGIVTEHKGVVWADLFIEGSGGHGAYPWNTKNPAWLLKDTLASLEQHFPPGEEGDWQITVTPTQFDADPARNQVPSTIRVSVDIRFPPDTCKTPEDALAQVRDVLPAGCTLSSAKSAQPLYTDKSNPMVTLYREAAETVIGQSIPFRREHGGTDARYFSERGIPAFLYGPKGGDIHSENEWVSLKSLEDHYQIYGELFEKLSNR